MKSYYEPTMRQLRSGETVSEHSIGHAKQQAKGRLVAMHPYTTEHQAKCAAAQFRLRGRSARIFKRGVKADGIELHLWVLVVREQRASREEE